MKINNHIKLLVSSFKRSNPVKTLDNLENICSCKDRTLQRRIKACNLLSSINMNSKFYTLPKFAEFDNYGIWSFQNIIFSIHGNLYQTVIYLVNQSQIGYTSNELSTIIHLKVDDALRILWKQHRLQREKHISQYVYFSPEQDKFKLQKIHRQQSTNIIRPNQFPKNKDITIAVLVAIIHQNTLNINTLLNNIDNHDIEVTTQQITSIIELYDFKKTNCKL